MAIVEQTVNGVPGFLVLDDPPEYRSQSILINACKSLRRALMFAADGDLSEAMRYLEYAAYARGVVAVNHDRRPSSRRVDTVASKVSLAIGRQIDRAIGRSW